MSRALRSLMLHAARCVLHADGACCMLRVSCTQRATRSMQQKHGSALPAWNGIARMLQGSCRCRLHRSLARALLRVSCSTQPAARRSLLRVTRCTIHGAFACCLLDACCMLSVHVASFTLRVTRRSYVRAAAAALMDGGALAHSRQLFQTSSTPPPLLFLLPFVRTPVPAPAAVLSMGAAAPPPAAAECRRHC